MKNALIAMAIYSTEENGKDEQLEKTFGSLYDTVDFSKHRLMVSINSKTDRTNEILYDFKDMIDFVFENNENLGTAKAINRVWAVRLPGQHCIKMDDDVVIHRSGWVDDMIECIERQPQIGIIGLKRKDCWEYPTHPDPNLQSQLIMLPHNPGEKWMVVEAVNHVIGTCQMYNSALLDKIGYLWQPTLYGWDDVLAAQRSHLAGFWNVFIPWVEIDHIDTGTTPYQPWKHREAGKADIDKIIAEYANGIRPIYESA